jgi:uncharacterized YigZ family protein
MDYKTPDNTARFEQTIKKSRFIAISTHVPDRERFDQFLDRVSTEFPDARHICYGGILGAPTTGQQLFNDDGEPSGTAGKPILNVLLHSGYGDVATAVVRYFGGVKLGAGGLVRAYSGSASGAVVQLSARTVEQTTDLYLEVEFALENTIRHLLGESGVSQLDARYEHNLQIHCAVPAGQVVHLSERLTDVTRGKILIRIADSDS